MEQFRLSIKDHNEIHAGIRSGNHYAISKFDFGDFMGYFCNKIDI